MSDAQARVIFAHFVRHYRLRARLRFTRATREIAVVNARGGWETLYLCHQVPLGLMAHEITHLRVRQRYPLAATHGHEFYRLLSPTQKTLRTRYLRILSHENQNS